MITKAIIIITRAMIIIIKTNKVITISTLII